VNDALIDLLYQVSLGKVPCDDRVEAAIVRATVDRPDLAMAATHALILAEYRQDLAEAESDGNTMLVTSIKRKIELVEELMLRAFETVE